MAFCSSCGTQVAEGVKFCPSCGAAVGGAAASGASAPTHNATEKVGNIRKCPACGVEVPAMTAVCPSCGHEFSGVKVASSVQIFFEKIDSLDQGEHQNSMVGGLLSFGKTDNAKISLIKSFPVPNTREDLLEFMVMAASRMESIGTMQTLGTSYLRLCTLGIWKGPVVNRYNAAWRSKLKECYTKSKIALSGNKDSLAQVEQIMSEVTKVEKKSHRMFAIAIAGVVAFYIALLAGTLGGSMALEKSEKKPITAETQRLESIVSDINADIVNKNYDSAHLKAAQLKWELLPITDYASLDIEKKAQLELWNQKRETLLQEIENLQKR